MSSKTQWLSGLYYADFISFYSPTQLCGGGTTKSNSNELPISVPLSFRKTFRNLAKNSRIEEVNHRENGSCYELVSIAIHWSYRPFSQDCLHGAVPLSGQPSSFFKHISRKLLDIMMGFAAGVMIAASFWSLLQPSIEYVENSPMGAWLGCQRLSVFSWRFFLRLIDAIVPLLHMTKEIDEAESIHTPREKKLSKTILLFLAITIHNFPEGLAVG